MYLTIRHYAGVAARIHELTPKLEGGLVPILKQTPGFKGYCAIGTEDGDGVSLTIFESEDQGVQANDRARSWVQSDLVKLLPETPEVFSGSVQNQAGPNGQEASFGSPGEPLYVLIRKFENISEPDKAEQFSREVSVPAHRIAPGFRGFYSLWGDPSRSRAAIVTLFDTRENADRANEIILDLIREKSGSAVPKPTRVVAGKASVIASPS
jgi:hypothetical protein